MAWGKKPCCSGCAEKAVGMATGGAVNKVSITPEMRNRAARLFADGGEARTDIGAADPEYTSIWPGSEYSTLGNIGGMLWRPFLRREVLKEEETRRVGDDTIEINPQTGMEEVMSTIQTFPGEYGPIESAWPTSMDIMNFGIENWLKAKAFLSTPEGREQALDIAQQLPSQAIEGAQDYMTQQVDMANRGLQETYDPETGEIKDFNIPKIAAEIMLGSLSRPAVEVAGNELITGMAVRPKRAVVRPASTYPQEERFADTGEIIVDDYETIREYEALLVDGLVAAGVSAEIAAGVGAKADKYFMTQLGTADDPIRQRMLQGDIKPAVYRDESDGFLGRDNPRNPFGVAGSALNFDTINNPLEFVRKQVSENNPYFDEARSDFEKAYDRATGVERTIVGADEYGDYPAFKSEANQMLSEGVPSDLIDRTEGGTGDIPLSLYADETRTLAETQDRLIAASDRPDAWQSNSTTDVWNKLPEYLRKAYEQQEMVYEVNPTQFSYGLDFLDPRELVPKLRGLSDEQLKGRSFPDLVVDAQSALISPVLQQTQVARRLEDAGSSLGADQRNARVPTELKTEVGVTPVYETPNRTWYSLDTDGAVELEGGLMNHSVGGYSSTRGGGIAYSVREQKDFADGTTKVFSLRDKDGRPRVTTDINFAPPTGPYTRLIEEAGLRVHTRQKGPEVLNAYGYDNADVSDEYLEELFALWKDLGVAPDRAMPDGVQGSGEQYQMYLEYDEIFNYTDAVDHIDSGLTKKIDPETGESFIPNPNDDDDDFAEGGIVSLVTRGDPNKHRRNQQRGNN